VRGGWAGEGVEQLGAGLGDRGRGREQGEDPSRRDVAGAGFGAGLVAARVVEHAGAERGGHRAGPAGQHLGAVRAGVTTTGQHLGAERALQVQLRPGQQRLRLPRRQAEDLTEIHLVPGAELERLELGRFQAHRRVPRHQAVVGIIAAKAHRRLVGLGRGHGPVLAARGPRDE
jgi:hypothetical protein